MNTQEAVEKLLGFTAQVKKANAEISNKFDALTKAINEAGEVPQAVAAAIDELGTSIQATDDLVPDAAPVEQSGDATGGEEEEDTDEETQQ